MDVLPFARSVFRLLVVAKIEIAKAREAGLVIRQRSAVRVVVCLQRADIDVHPRGRFGLMRDDLQLRHVGFAIEAEADFLWILGQSARLPAAQVVVFVELGRGVSLILARRVGDRARQGLQLRVVLRRHGVGVGIDGGGHGHWVCGCRFEDADEMKDAPIVIEGGGCVKFRDGDCSSQIYSLQCVCGTSRVFCHR